MAHAKKHGLSRTPEYAAWVAMRHRCNNPESQSYGKYGGRGITISKRWSDVVKFYADMGPRPTPLHTLDRKNNDGNYSRRNCRWATTQEQNENRSVSKTLTVNGRTQPLQKWCDETGIKYTTLIARLERWHWSPERAVSVPAGSVVRDKNKEGQYV